MIKDYIASKKDCDKLNYRYYRKQKHKINENIKELWNHCLNLQLPVKRCQ